MSRMIFALFFSVLLLTQHAKNTLWAQALTSSDLLTVIEEQVRKGNHTEALALADQLVKDSPQNPDGFLVRAKIYEEINQPEKAVSDYTQALKLNARATQIYHKRGTQFFKLGRVTEALADFDSFIRTNPQQAPYHWQRGIACYEAGQFELGKRQFQLHQKVNANDVENAAWHFLCNARARDFNRARAELLQVKFDPRVPMMELYSLYGGIGSVEDVFKAATKDNAKDGSKMQQFYANFYVGLFYEAKGEQKVAKGYVEKAVNLGIDNFMGDVARVHLDRMKTSATTQSPPPIKSPAPSKQ